MAKQTKFLSNQGACLFSLNKYSKGVYMYIDMKSICGGQSNCQLGGTQEMYSEVQSFIEAVDTFLKGFPVQFGYEQRGAKKIVGKSEEKNIAGHAEEQAYCRKHILRKIMLWVHLLSAGEKLDVIVLFSFIVLLSIKNFIEAIKWQCSG